MWTTFGKSNFLWAIFEEFMIDLEQDAVDLSLEHIKAQNTWLRWLHVKYLLGQYCMWTTFGKSNYLWAIFEEFMILFEQHAVDLSLEHTKAQHTWIWWPNVWYLLGQSALWITFGKSNFFLRLSDRAWQPLSRTRWIFRWNIPNHNILEFGCWMWKICSGSVLCGQLWEMIIKNFFGWFLNISQYPWAQNCGSIIGICQSST